MSENTENQNIVDEKVSTQPSQDGNVENGIQEEEKQNTKAESNVESNDTPEKQDENVLDKVNYLFDFLKQAVKLKNDEMQDNQDKYKYLSENLIKYDTDEYFKNESFKDLYTEAFNLLGTKLDTPKFIDLLDKYVSSRMDIHSKNLAAKKENDSVTDSFDFKSGLSKKEDKKLRFQDIPEEELEKYIAKYI